MRKKSERGVLLVFTLVIIFIVAAVTGTLLTITTSGSKREVSRDYKFKSREIAEAGLDFSLNMLRQATDNVDNDGDGVADEGIDDVDWFDPVTVATLEGNLGRIGTLNWSLADDSDGDGWPDFGEPNVNSISISGGEIFSYSRFSEDDGIDNDGDLDIDDLEEAGKLTLCAFGRYDDYESRVQYSGIFTETMADPNPPTWAPNAAFVAGGDLTVTGNCDITGVEGNIHSNGYMDLGGSSSVAGNATSSNGGSINPGNVAGTIDTAAPLAPIPDINTATMQDIRDRAITDGMDVYLLNPDGSITKDGAVVSAGGSYHGWSLGGGGEWSLSSKHADLDGLFYATGDVKLTGGKVGISMTVLTEGNIQMSGNGKFTAYYEDLFLVSLMDIQISGTPQETGDLGVILAREQVKTTGNAFVRGTIMAADLDNASSAVQATMIASTMLEQTMITGNFDIEYNGGMTTNIPVYNPNNERFRLDPTFAAYEER